MRNILILLMLFVFNSMTSQEIIEMKEVYEDNNLVYKVVDDKLFTGIAQVKRKNKHLVYEEEFKGGVILLSYLYSIIKTLIIPRV